MSGSSVDMGIKNIWRAWRLFRRGKRRSEDSIHFETYLEQNLFHLQRVLESGSYRHGPYARFTVHDNKTREVVVASVSDRVLHRVLYEYLVPIFDKTFIYDVWSCRTGKGLLKAIERAQNFMTRYRNSFVWRGDIRKFFDSVDHETLFRILRRRVTDPKTLVLLKEVIESYAVCEREREREYFALQSRASHREPHKSDFCQHLLERV